MGCNRSPLGVGDAVDARTHLQQRKMEHKFSHMSIFLHQIKTLLIFFSSSASRRPLLESRGGTIWVARLLDKVAISPVNIGRDTPPRYCTDDASPTQYSDVTQPSTNTPNGQLR